MRAFGVTCLLLVGIALGADLSRADDAFDFQKVQADIAEHGLSAVLNQLDASNPLLAAALRHVQPYLHDDPHQLWFQLQARTRIEGWEDFQQQLRSQTPDDTLIALTSNLAPVPSGFEQPPALPADTTLRQHAISPDGAWEAEFTTRSFKILQLASSKTLEFELSDQDAAALGEISSIALNTAGGFATIGGTEPVVLHYQLRSRTTTLVKLEDTDNTQFRLYQFRQSNRQPRPGLRVIVTPDTRHAVLWGTKHVASFNALTGENEFKAAAPVHHFGRRYGFLSGERIAINYAVALKGRQEGLLIYDLASGKQAANLEHGESQTGIAIHAATDTILTSGKVMPRFYDRERLMVWNATTGKRDVLPLPEMYGNVIGISADGQRFLTLSRGGGVVFVWDMETRQVLHRFDLGIDVMRGRLDGSTLVVTVVDKRKNQTEHWFEYHRGN